MAKPKYYSLDKILKTDSEFNLLLGERANGKSYAVAEHCLKDYLENGHKMVFVRRYKEEASITAVEEWFVNLGAEKIMKMTNNKYDSISCWQGKIYLSKIDENYKKVKGEIIGRYCALNRANQLKSTFQDITFYNIVYEEFITNEIYLYDEPNKLQDFVVTVLRKRKGKVWLIGNTISQVSPYYSEWELFNVLEQEQGTIDLYKKSIEVDGVHKDLQIAVELCLSSSLSSTMVFGHKAKQINGQSWTGKDYPKSNTLGTGYEQIYTLFIHTVQFNFLMSLLINDDTGDMVLQVTNAYKKPTATDRVITNLISPNRLWTPQLDPTRKVETLIGKLWKQRKIFYKTDLIGQNFEQIEKILKVF